MFNKVAIDDSAMRMTAIRAALETAMPSRVHKTSFLRSFEDHERAELLEGVVMVVSGEEGDFNTRHGMEAREGTQSIALVVQIEVPGDNDGEAVEAEEFAIIKEIKAFVRTGIDGIGLDLERVYQSSQQETPYGYVVAQLNAGPPRETLR